MDNKCVSCGKIIPEGRQVCPSCETGEVHACEKCIHYGVCSDIKERLKEICIPMDLSCCGHYEEHKETQGEWIKTKTGFMCSNCDEHFPSDKLKYCYNCGAKMRGE